MSTYGEQKKRKENMEFEEIAELIVADDEHEPANDDDEARIVAGNLPGIVADGGAGEPGMW